MPVVLRIGRFRFFFFSNEGNEPPHIHVRAAGDEAKFWLDPVQLAANYGFNAREITDIEQLVDEHREDLLAGMSTSTDPKAHFQRTYVPTTALAKQVDFDDVVMRITFTDGRVLSVPLSWSPLLRNATPEQRAKYEIGGGGISLHWSDIDEDLSIAGLMAGVDRNAG